MRYRQLGDSGLTVSVVGLGCNNFGGRSDLAESRAVVHAALDAGINLLDTSNSYGNKGGSETILGEVLKGHRDKVVLATKFGSDMRDGPADQARCGRRYVRRAVEDSLRRLQTDHIDLYQLHKPDPLTPLSETLGVLDELVKEGKVLYIGSSNLAPWKIAHCEWASRSANSERFISAQNHMNLLDSAPYDELVEVCKQYKVGILPYFPLANGLLTGKYHRGKKPPQGTRLADRPAPSDEIWDRLETLSSFASERGHSLLELAFAGLLAHPEVSSVIAGATKPDQIKANVAASSWQLSERDLASIPQRF